jgi:hypothetical protein
MAEMISSIRPAAGFEGAPVIFGKMEQQWKTVWVD